MGLLSGIFGGGSKTSFTLPDKEARAKIDELSTFGKSQVTGPSKAGELTIEDIARQRQLALDKSAQLGQSGQQTQLSNLALFGGAGGGAGERLARQSDKQQQLTNQGLFGQFGGLETQALASDLANEQARRDSARNAALQGELGLLGARTSAELGRAGIDAQSKAQRGQLFGTIGTIAGTAFGGPLGGAVGGLFGSSLA